VGYPEPISQNRVVGGRDKNSVKIILFKGWLLKGQSHYLQIKNVGIKLQRQKSLVKKHRQSSPFSKAVKGFISRAQKRVKKEANQGSEITKNQSGTIRHMLLKRAWLLKYH
jgi:hypothetical protein